MHDEKRLKLFAINNSTRTNCESKLSGRASALRERISKQPERDRELGGCKQFV